MRALLLAVAALAAMTGVTLAAPPMFDWTGFYAGGFVGGGGSVSNWTNIYDGYEEKDGPVISLLGSGLIGGVNIGGNFQTGQFVIGGEATFGLGHIGSSGTCFGAYDGVHATCSTTMGPFGTLAAKIGVTEGETLFYLKGGVAVANFTYTAGDFVGFTDPNYPDQTATKTGLLIGVGVDHQIMPQTILSGSIELMNFGSHRQAFPSPSYDNSTCNDCYNAPFSTDILDKVVVAKVGVFHTFN